MKEIHDRLRHWCIENLIDLKGTDNEYLFSSNNSKFLIILPKRGKVIEKGCLLKIDEEDLERFEEFEPDYLLFEFGGRWYYTAPKIVKSEYDESFAAEFNDFKCFGTPTILDRLKFVHLGVHTEFELLNGSGNVKDWAKKAKFLQHPSLGVCDKKTLAGTLPLQLECEKNGIKLIIGETIPVVDKFNPEKTNQIIHDVKLYVKNEIGWKNLLNLNNKMNVEYAGEYVKRSDLFDHSDGLILVFPRENCMFSTMDDEKAFMKKHRTYAKYFQEVYYQFDSVEYYDDKHDIDYLNKLKKLRQLSSKFSLKLVLINDSYYIDREQFFVKESLNKINFKAMKYSEDEYYKNLEDTENRLKPLFKNDEEYEDFIMQIVHHTTEIDNLCNFKIEIGKPRMPKYEFVPKGKTAEEMFDELIWQGFEEKVVKRGKDIEKYKERIYSEMDVIKPSGMIDYFLLLWDIIHWSKSEDIMVGISRGSVGGSLITYCLDITDIDPIEYDLMFERFLNKTRVSPLEFIDVFDKETGKLEYTYKAEEIGDNDYDLMIDQLQSEGKYVEHRKEMRADSIADIDCDFPSQYRDVVKMYIKERFGESYTCSVGTYTKLQLKAGLKDFCRVFGLTYDYVNRITKYIDHQIDYEWKDLIKYALQHKELYEFCQKNPQIVHAIKHTLKQPRSYSIHASAVLIVPKEKDGNPIDIFSWMPLRVIDGMLISEWEGKYTDRAGFLKEDILGLEQLDKFMMMLDLIKRNTGEEILLHEIPVDDVKTFKAFSKGYNEDVFQFTGEGIKLYSRQVKPDSIEDIIAMNALWRPGAMDSNAHNDFAAIKHGKKKAKFDYMLKEVTQKTHGLYIYQEQIMQAVVVLGNFTAVESDTFRTAIKKFDNKTMKSYEERFIDGAVANGCDKYEAVKIWNKLLAFSGYGFNRAHSAAYGLTAYWSQWFKNNYPLEFWTTALQFAKDDAVVYCISEMSKMKQGITLSPPSINVSTERFECDAETNTIYWSLIAIKGIAEATAGKIINERNKNGEFKSYIDFTKRIPRKMVNKNALANMILSGVFDEVEGIEFPEERIKLLILHYSKQFEELPDEYKTKEASKRYYWVFKQKTLTGYGLVDYRVMLINNGYKREASKFITADKFFTAEDYKEVCICGVVNSLVIKETRHGKSYANMQIISNNDIIYTTFWEEELIRLYESSLENITGRVIAMTGKVKFDDYKSANCLIATENTKIIYL